VSEIVDLFAFVHQEVSREGVNPLTDFSRLAQETDATGAQVVWSVRGRMQKIAHQYDAQGNPVLQPRLSVAAETELQRPCDRCGQSVAVPLQVQATLAVFTSEAEADAAPLDEDAYDPIVGNKKFDLLHQIEEELLLEIPDFVTHASCMAGQGDDSSVKSRDNPFQKLEVLKIKKVS
jgi:uncharacterized protein